jgi:hypothetical protein
MATTIRAELAAAIRAINATYDRLPEDGRPEVAWTNWDEALNRALLAADRQQARETIRAWRDHHLEMLEAIR